MKLLNDVQAGKTKQPYQTYVIEHGIDHVSVKVPKANAARFETEFDAALIDVKITKQQLLEIVTRHGGTKLRE